MIIKLTDDIIPKNEPKENPDLAEFNRELIDFQKFCTEKGLLIDELPLDVAGPMAENDTGNAKQLVNIAGANLRYCFTWGTWLCWNGKQWQKDEIGEIWQYAKILSRKYALLASQCSDNKEYARLLKYAVKLGQLKTLKSMIELARDELAILPESFDKDIWRLNVQNGIINLKTGELLKHNPKDYITKISPIEYIPAATCPEWKKFLFRIMAGNENLISFLQLALGCALTGDVSEQCLFFLFGSGANGKSTLLNIILYILGDYSQQSPIETLMVKNREGISNDIARLRGARFVSANEAEEGKQLAESTIKQLTGGDLITARFLHAEFFEFRPEFKLFISTNHKPVIKGTDNGIWRRIRLIPFKVTIPPEEQDKNLFEKLKAESPGILNWLILGCLAWQKEGLIIPDEVKTATNNYRDEMDNVNEFFNMYCIFDSNLRTYAMKINTAYEKFCQENGIEPVKPKALGLRLKERGCIQIRMNDRNSSRGWQGVNVSDMFDQSARSFKNVSELEMV